MRHELIAGPACVLALLAVPAAAAAHDHNDNRIPDRWEKKHRISIEKDFSQRDFDDDGVRTREEFRLGMNPRDDDSDDDGTHDGDEVAGTIVSFTGGVLTLKLVDGSTLQGAVTDATEIECEGDDDGRGDDDDRGDGERGDDDHGDGDDSDDDERGDDRLARAAHDDDDDGSPACTTALVAGARVHEAELTGPSNALVFEEIELED
jgi:hypothetical protein